MIRRSCLRVLFFLAACLLVGVAAVSAETKRTQDPSAVIWCYDAGHSIVTRKQAWRCSGQIVDEAEARKIREQRTQRLLEGFAKPEPLFRKMRLRGTGSGFYVSADGYFLTNHHVVDRCRGISMTPAGGDALKAELVATDTIEDLALLRTPGRRTVAAPFRDPPRVGRDEGFAVVGYPLHGKVTIKPVLVTGTAYHGRGRPGRYRFAMKIDVRRGNSGGPAMDRSGRVVGVVVAKVNTPQVFATTGKLIRDVGVAIRSSVALRFLRSNGVPVVTSRRAAPMTDRALFDHAHRFVGQVGCWR